MGLSLGRFFCYMLCSEHSRILAAKSLQFSTRGRVPRATREAQGPTGPDDEEEDMTISTELWGPLGSARPDRGFGRSSWWAHGQPLSRALRFHQPNKKQRGKSLSQTRGVDERTGGHVCTDLGLNV